MFADKIINCYNVAKPWRYRVMFRHPCLLWFEGVGVTKHHPISPRLSNIVAIDDFICKHLDT
jgi:hypothetical protein